VVFTSPPTNRLKYRLKESSLPAPVNPNDPAHPKHRYVPHLVRASLLPPSTHPTFRTRQYSPRGKKGNSEACCAVTYLRASTTRLRHDLNAAARVTRTLSSGSLLNLVFLLGRISITVIVGVPGGAVEMWRRGEKFCVEYSAALVGGGREKERGRCREKGEARLE